MKTTMEFPDSLFRQAKAVAAVQGISLRDLLTQALTEKLRLEGKASQPWMNSFGKLRHLRAETARLNGLMEEEFGNVEPEDRL